MKPILVPTDFSDAAINATEYAIELAKEFNTSVILLHVYQLPIPIATGAPITLFQDVELQTINENHLQTEANRLSLKFGTTINFRATCGDIVNEILDEEKNVSMIVMGMKGANLIEEKLIGSTATATFGKTKKTLLIIPENVVYKRPEKIAIACDFNEHSKVNSLDGLYVFINTYHSKLYMVNVKTMKEIPAIEEEAEAYLKNSSIDDEPIWYFPIDEDPVNGINHFVNAKGIDMVAIIPHHYNFLEGLFHQRTSKKMAFHTQVPLLVLAEK